MYKNVHFTFNYNIVELEKAFIPNLNSNLWFWRHFDDDSIFFVTKGSIKFILDNINNFYKNIKFNFKEEKQGKISFSGLSLVWNNQFLDTKVYRKKTHTNLLSEPKFIWTKNLEMVTLKTIVTRAFEICWSDKILQKETKYIQTAFHFHNNYAFLVNDKVINEVKEKLENTTVINENFSEIHGLDYHTKLIKELILLSQFKDTLGNYLQMNLQFT